MRRLWLGVLALSAAIFFWQAGRIWISLNRTTPLPSSENTEAPAAAEKTDLPELVQIRQQHTVAAGETLHSIGLKYNIRWESLADLNGLTENAPIREGQILDLPLTISGHLVIIELITVDQVTAQNAQNDARFGGVTWRLDPIEVVRSTAPSTLGLTPSTAFKIEERDDDAGRVVVTTTDRPLPVRLWLIQPIEKGATGVWFINKTETYRWPTT